MTNKTKGLKQKENDLWQLTSKTTNEKWFFTCKNQVARWLGVQHGQFDSKAVSAEWIIELIDGTNITWGQIEKMEKSRYDYDGYRKQH